MGLEPELIGRMNSALLYFIKNVARMKRSVIREIKVTHPRIPLRFIRATGWNLLVRLQRYIGR